MLVQKMYDKLALITGFPVYTNESDTPETTRFLLEMLTQGLKNTIDDLYTSNNVLERNDTIITIPNHNDYAIEGIIKDISYINDEGIAVDIPYNDYANPNRIITEKERKSHPESYVIHNGYLRLLPTPDKEYEVHVCVSTTDLVLADDDTCRTNIESVNDAIVANERFCDLVVTKASVILLARLRNPSFEVQSQMYENNLRTFLEHDSKTIEANRGFDRNGGHYNTNTGLFGEWGGTY